MRPALSAPLALPAVAPPVDASAPSPARAPAPPASSPSTAELLNRITEGVLRQDRERGGTSAPDRPWQAGSRPANPLPPSSFTAAGERVERFKSANGELCVRFPNAAAYRSANGVNLAVASNCP
jgi:hypothetical protein